MIFHVVEDGNGFDFYVESESVKALKKHFANHKFIKIETCKENVYKLDDAVELFG